MGRSSTDCESSDKDNYEVDVKNARKCIRKGDTIYYSKPENINMMRNVEKVPLGSTASSYDKSDKVLSGESVYKSFTFEQSPNDEETEKCIAFWKSVMEKNLAPIKCAIIENKSKKLNGSSKEIIKENDGDVQETYTKTPEEDKVDVEKEIEKVHEQYRKMWRDIFKEIQKRKLNEMELIRKSRCTFCESITPNTKNLDKKVDKNEIVKEVKQLDDWKSPGWRQKIGSSPLKSTTIPEKDKKEPEKQESLEAGKDNKTSSDLTSWSEMAEQKSSEKYLFENIIETKKRDGVYSEWRTNNLKYVCMCNTPSICRCNQNPAVQGIISTSVPEKNKSVLKMPSTLKVPNEDIQLPAVDPNLLQKYKRRASKGSNSSIELAKDRLSKIYVKSSSDELVTVLQLKSKSALQSIKWSAVDILDFPRPRNSTQCSILKTSLPKGTPQRSQDSSIKIRCNCSVEDCDCSDILPIKGLSQGTSTQSNRIKDIETSNSDIPQTKHRNLNEDTTEGSTRLSFPTSALRAASSKADSLDLIRQRSRLTKPISLGENLQKVEELLLTETQNKLSGSLNQETLKKMPRRTKLGSDQNTTSGNMSSKDYGNLTSTTVSSSSMPRSQWTQNGLEIIYLHKAEVSDSDS